MAPKRPTPLEDPPAASSSEEEEEETSSGEEDGSSSEEEQEPPKTQNLTAKKPDSTTKKPESESDSESGSESEDDDDKPKNPPHSTVKPIASKPMDETPPKTTKPRSKATMKSTTATTTSVKRGSEVDRERKDSKRAKKKDSETDGVAGEKSEDTKKQLFQRLWSEEDEIALLKGIIEFTENNGVDPIKDMASFFDYIKKSLHFNATLAQLKDKVLRLKKKFENHVMGKKGVDKTFSKAHDQKTFDLSKKIWGADRTLGGLDTNVKPNGKAKRIVNSTNSNSKSLASLKAELGMDADKESEKVDKMDCQMEAHSSLQQIPKFDKSAGVTGMEDYVLRKGLDVVDGAKKAEMEEKWRKLHVAELELFLKRNDLIREQAKLMLASYKKE